MAVHANRFDQGQVSVSNILTLTLLLVFCCSQIRISLGSIVLYETGCRGGDSAAVAARTRGPRLLGVVVEDLGGTQFKVGETGQAIRGDVRAQGVTAVG